MDEFKEFAGQSPVNNFFNLFKKPKLDTTFTVPPTLNRTSKQETASEFYTLTLNKSNLNTFTQTSNKNVYTYHLPTDLIVKFKETPHIALSNISIYNSFGYNIASNTFIRVFKVNGVVNTSIDIQYPTGFYTIQDLIDVFYQGLIFNGWYLLDNYGNYVFYHNMYYSEQDLYLYLSFTPIPTSLPVNWQQPLGWTAFPTVSQTGQILIQSPFSFLGLPMTQVPTLGTTIQTSIQSNVRPKSSSLNSILVSCNLINSLGLCNPSNIIFTHAVNPDTFGELLSFQINPIYTLIEEGIYNQVELIFYDNQYKNLIILDENVFITLLMSN